LRKKKTARKARISLLDKETSEREIKRSSQDPLLALSKEEQGKISERPTGEKSGVEHTHTHTYTHTYTHTHIHTYLK